MIIMSKCGQQDNVVTYEHICDATADLRDINPQYITLGSVAIVIKGATGLEVYMATSDKEWILLSAGTDNGSSEDNSDIVDIGLVDYMTLKS